jgi:hypothetical protein
MLEVRVKKLTLFFMFLLAVVCIFAFAVAFSHATKKLTFKDDGSFKILHLSDVHYRIGPDQPCNDVTRQQSPYCQDGAKNTTDFISRLIAAEQPDLVVHTGDIIDGSTHSAAQGMDDLYGVTFGEGIAWAATMGNHDDNSDLSRPEVMEYILSLPGGLSELNALGSGDTESYGNFFLEIFENKDAKKPSFRTFHLDSTTNNMSINAQQVDWFTHTAERLSAVKETPALAFFHVPLEEYEHVLRQGKICGAFHEPVSWNGQSGLFDAIVADGSVKATFAGHDHTNHFCGLYKGVQLCYEGSPGYQGYMNCNKRDQCLNRMARVTEIGGYGSFVRSWKRQADATYPETSPLDSEILWAHNEGDLTVHRHADDCQRAYSMLSDDEYASLRSNRAAHYAALKEL